jgi:hypothetical protein
MYEEWNLVRSQFGVVHLCPSTLVCPRTRRDPTHHQDQRVFAQLPCDLRRQRLPRWMHRVFSRSTRCAVQPNHIPLLRFNMVLGHRQTRFGHGTQIGQGIVREWQHVEDLFL